MIKDISQIKNKSLNFIRNFINNCYIEEKIDTHYVIVEITSKQHITIKKASGKIIDRVDMILNNMWGQLVTDWNYIKLANKDLFSNHVGYVLHMFYFPNNKPLNTEYKDNIRYVIDRITFNDEIINTESFINKIQLKDKFNIKVKKTLNKEKDLNNIISDINLDNKNNIDYIELFNKLINKDANIDIILAKGNPEGYIFKWNKHLYQYIFNIKEPINIEKTQYEFLLCDFIKYCKEKNYTDKILNNYTKTVCSLFNDYIINWESNTHTIENNIDINSIQAPNQGTNFDIGYEYIPDIITLNLCKQNELYKSIFKVLLANLRRGKDNKNCIYMNKKQVDDWNHIMKNIKIRTINI